VLVKCCREVHQGEARLAPSPAGDRLRAGAVYEPLHGRHDRGQLFTTASSSSAYLPFADSVRSSG
jgi:hypothetical protein